MIARQVSVATRRLIIHLSRSYIGYANANYALSEVREPVQTIKRAAPLAMISVTSVYIFINIAYFSVVSKADILGSKRIVAFVAVTSLSSYLKLTALLQRSLL